MVHRHRALISSLCTNFVLIGTKPINLTLRCYEKALFYAASQTFYLSKDFIVGTIPMSLQYLYIGLYKPYFAGISVTSLL